MSSKHYRLGLNTLPLAAALASGTSVAASEDKRRFDVRDSVEMSYFATLGDSQRDDLDDDANGRSR